MPGEAFIGAFMWAQPHVIYQTVSLKKAICTIKKNFENQSS